MIQPQNAPSRFQKIVSMVLLVFSGGFATISLKFLYEQKAIGQSVISPHFFRKPWLTTDMMFIGMSLAIFYGIFVEKASFKIPLKCYLIMLLITFFDMSASFILNYCLLSIHASVWQMLRGSVIFFSFLICTFILKRRAYSFMWVAISMILIAMSIIGVSAVISTGVANEGVSVGKVVLSIFFIFFAQIFIACEFCFQDYLTNNFNLSPAFIVGCQGIIGFILVSSICLPTAQHIKSEEGNGLYENSLDSFLMIFNDPIILILCFLYIILAGVYNFCSVYVMNLFSSAVNSTIMEGMRTLLIWITEIALFYILRGSDYGNEHPSVGEEWNIFSWIQLIGFIFLIFGTFLFNEVFHLPCFRVELKSDEILLT